MTSAFGAALLTQTRLTFPATPSTTPPAERPAFTRALDDSLRQPASTARHDPRSEAPGASGSPGASNDRRRTGRRSEQSDSADDQVKTSDAAAGEASTAEAAAESPENLEAIAEDASTTDAAPDADSDAAEDAGDDVTADADADAAAQVIAYPLTPADLSVDVAAPEGASVQAPVAGQAAPTGKGTTASSDARQTAANSGEFAAALDTKTATPNSPTPAPTPANAMTANPSAVLPVTSGDANSSASQHPAPQAPPPPPPTTETPEQAANLARVARALRSALNQQGGSVTMRLSPPELGLVKISLQVQHGVVSASFEAEQESVRHLLSSQLGQLRESLQSQGLTVERVDVHSRLLSAWSGAQQGGLNDSAADGRSRGSFGRWRGRSSSRGGGDQTAFAQTLQSSGEGGS